ncbi:MAG: Uma2 family endonuclease [Lachnospiraceae bacterium]|nr:Uma2 family endonuclease [Lachnospiraceae bacterium]
MIEERIKNIKSLKEKHKLTNAQIADLSGVPYGTVIKILGGVTKSPNYAKIIAIEEALFNFMKDEAGSMDYGAIDLKRFSKTLDDYYALPTDTRAELIDGYIFDMSAPSIWHQNVIGNMFVEIASYIKANKGPCRAIISPVDVQLDQDDKTMIEPDLVIVCDPEKIKDKCIYGAPDFVLEVTSKSTRSRDFVLKLSKYKNAGVREYWIIDEKSQKVYVYSHLDIDEEFIMKIYSFTDTVPVGIYEDLSIDMNDIFS